MAITASISPLDPSVSEGSNVDFTVTFSGDETVKEVVGYKWLVDDVAQSGETSTTFSKTFDSTGSFTVKCNVTYALVSDDGAEPVVLAAESTVTVEEVPALDGKHWFVHPLAFKNSSFSWVPYWVHDWMVANPTWRQSPAESPWPIITYSIDQAVEQYGECLMQESRNGYIYKASAYTK